MGPMDRDSLSALLAAMRIVGFCAALATNNQGRFIMARIWAKMNAELPEPIYATVPTVSK
jgi:hypothetical protein